MEETKNIWSKTPAELTVKEIVIVNVVVPIIVMGGLVAGVVVIDNVSKARDKFRTARINRQLKKSVQN